MKPGNDPSAFGQYREREPGRRPAAPVSRPGTRARRTSRAPLFVLIGGLGLALVLVLLGARLAATPAAPPDLSQPGTAAQPRQVNVILRDYVFNPTPLFLVPGEVVEFNLINAGLVAHEFVLGDGAVQAAWAAAHAAATAPAPFATPPPASVPPDRAGMRALLATGASAKIRYTVPTVGELELFCHLPGHVEQGMVGEVVLDRR